MNLLQRHNHLNYMNYIDSINSTNINSGYLTIVIGPMFSGKTSHLIHKYNSITSIDKQKTIVINHYSDNRYSDKEEIISHDGTSIPCMKIESLRELYSLFCNKELHHHDYKYLFINESQFFNDLHLIIIFVEKYKFNVYIYGLDGDFQQKTFE